MKPNARYRRSPSAVVFWRGQRCYCRPWQSGRTVGIGPDILRVMDQLAAWSTADQAAARAGVSGSVSEVLRLFERLRYAGLLEREDAPHRWDAMAEAWHPEAGLFHFATRNMTFGANPLDYDAELRNKAKTQPPPAPTRTLPGARVRLPEALPIESLSDVLERRRTWRRFGGGPMAPAALATLLNSTFAVQRWGRVAGQGRIALKTSPSAGARHPLEAYLLIRDVDGVKRGAYHFDSSSRELVRVGPLPAPRRVARLLGNQRYFANAAVIVFMVAIFERTLWRYPSSRAYRTVLIDAGHLGQTFCLTATALNLAPFCTMAFIERELDAIFHLDPIHESPMYVVGAGMPDARAGAHPGRIPRRRVAHGTPR